MNPVDANLTVEEDTQELDCYIGSSMYRYVDSMCADLRSEGREMGPSALSARNTIRDGANGRLIGEVVGEHSIHMIDFDKHV